MPARPSGNGTLQAETNRQEGDSFEYVVGEGIWAVSTLGWILIPKFHGIDRNFDIGIYILSAQYLLQYRGILQRTLNAVFVVWNRKQCERTSLTNATRSPEEHCFTWRFRPICSSGRGSIKVKMSVEYLWNDTDTGSNYLEKPSWSRATLSITNLTYYDLSLSPGLRNVRRVTLLWDCLMKYQ